jgi:hypothetical protein
MTGKMSRTKGATFERLVAKKLHLLTGVKFDRNLSQYQKKGQGDLTPDSADWPFLIECKHCNTAELPAWRRQAVAAAEGTGKAPCVIYRITGGPIRVQVPLSALCAAWPSDEWADITLEGLCFIAAERMASPGSWHPNDFTRMHREWIGGDE